MWTKVHKEALTIAQCISLLGLQPNELHYAEGPLWLNSEVPATRSPRRAGHGVAVTLKIYARRIDAQADVANQRTAAFGSQDT